jgi:ATP-dependent protease HslVU (ClpYQ) peptidase subunit
MIAADSQESYGTDRKFLNCQKLFKNKGEILATAGHSSTGMLFYDWYFGTQDDEERLELTRAIDWDDDFHILIWNDEGLFEVDKYFRWIEVPEAFYAVGSGAAAALGAMYMGANAEEAVKVAKDIDVFTGGKVVTLKL